MLMYCVRHGESIYNAHGRIQGHLNIPLSELGRRQAAAVANACRAWGSEAVFCSPLRRARETAEPIAAASGLPIQIEPNLIEIRVGIFQGHNRSDLDQLCPEEYSRWRSGDPDYVVPGGESRRALMQRGREVLESIAQREYATAIVVSHGAILAAAFKSLLEIPAQRHPFLLENASVSRLEIGDSTTRLHSLNEVWHLHGVGLAGGGDL
jgi:2,3-bisphosphoglycerate-dependent phosphoglycerate mutase